MEEIKAYKPKCCSKAYITKRACVEHEKRCLWNPDNEACHTCEKKGSGGWRGKTLVLSCKR